MNTKLFGKKWRIVKLILVAVTFLLFTAAMGRQVSADDTPAIYNYTGPNSTTQMPNNNQGIEFSTRLMVNGKLGPYPLMNFSQKSSAIVDADRTTSISIEVIINNTTDKDFGRVGYGGALPRWINPGSQVVAAQPFKPQTQNGLTTGYPQYVGGVTVPTLTI